MTDFSKEELMKLAEALTNKDCVEDLYALALRIRQDARWGTTRPHTKDYLSEIADQIDAIAKRLATKEMT